VWLLGPPGSSVDVPALSSACAYGSLTIAAALSARPRALALSARSCSGERPSGTEIGGILAIVAGTALPAISA